MSNPRPSFALALASYLWSAKLVLAVLLLAIVAVAGAISLEGFTHAPQTSTEHGFFGALYCSFVTAWTIGYGDYVPAGTIGRILAVLLGLIGMIFTGIIVAASVNALRDSRA